MPTNYQAGKIIADKYGVNEESACAAVTAEADYVMADCESNHRVTNYSDCVSIASDRIQNWIDTANEDASPTLDYSKLAEFVLRTRTAYAWATLIGRSMVGVKA